MATRRLLWIVVFALTACAGHRRPTAEPFQVVVRDAADQAPLQDAVVTVWVEGGMAAPLQARTDPRGLATLPPPPKGTHYQVRVERASYAPVQQTAADAPLEVSLMPSLHGPRERDFKAFVSGARNQDPLAAGELQEVVRVSGRAAVIDLAESANTTTLGGEFVQDLPVPGRFYQNVITLAPGGNGDALASGPPPASIFPPLVEQDFTAAADVATSTFGVDVDRASYSLARRYLLEWRQRPPKDAIRLEEMVNYFPYDYPDPPARAPMAVYVDDAPARWAPAHRLVRIGLQARRREVRQLPPSTLVFLVDVSGSMDAPDRLPLVQSALRDLADELRPQDRVALVTYADAARLVLPATPGDRKAGILDALDGLRAEGGTAGADGLQLAYGVAERSRRPGDNTRVILATDGDFNVGPSSDVALLALVEGHRARKIALSVLGVGSGGDLQHGKMEAIADHGDGNYAYADSILEARRALVEEMGGTLTTVARDVKVQVAFNPTRVQAWRLLGYENRALLQADFEDDAKDGGEMGAGHSVTAFYAVVPGEGPEERYAPPEWMDVQVRWQPPQGGPSELILIPAILGKDTTSPDFRFASAVAEFALVLRDSAHKGDASVESAIERARETMGADADGRRAELVALMEAYRTAR